MTYTGDKAHQTCQTCRTKRRIVRCQSCYGRGGSCYACQGTGYQCERGIGDPQHRWKKRW